MTPDSRYPTGPKEDHPSASLSLRPILEFMGVLVAIVGVVAAVVGLAFGIKMLGLIFGALESPQELAGKIDALAQAIGGDNFSMTIAGGKVALAKPLAAILLGLGAALLACVSLGFIGAGIRSVTWLLTDREAVKRILRDAFPQGKPRRGGDFGADKSGRP